MNKSLILLSYGPESEYRRAIFCVFSFLAWCKPSVKNTRIIIYTDRTEVFESYLSGLSVEYVLLTPELTEEMLAGSTYIHRKKVSVIDLTFKNYTDSDLLFLDSDTFFTSSGEKMLNGFSSGKSFMHKREYNFTDGLALFSSFNQGEYPKAFINYITGREFMINGKPEVFDVNDYSWNSGVLGLSRDFKVYMPDVFKLTDEFYANSQWFISEQLAFSLILQKRTEIRSADDFVCHYWGKRQKVLLDGLLADLFNRYTAADLKDEQFIQRLTENWKKKVDVDQLMEQSVIALAQGGWKFGIRKCLQAILKSPFDSDIYKEFITTFKKD